MQLFSQFLNCSIFVMLGPFVDDCTVWVFPIVEGRTVAENCLNHLHLNVERSHWQLYHSDISFFITTMNDIDLSASGFFFLEEPLSGTLETKGFESLWHKKFQTSKQWYVELLRDIAIVTEWENVHGRTCKNLFLLYFYINCISENVKKQRKQGDN